MNISEIASKRYACKAYNPEKKISDEKINELANVVEFAPSSVNLQPVRTFFISDKNTKHKIAESVLDTNWKYNAPVIENCSYLAVFAIDTEDLQKQILNTVDNQIKAGRTKAEKKEDSIARLNEAIETALKDSGASLTDWYTRQAYLAAGQLLLSAEAMEINSTPMEGFVPAKIDQILGLKEKKMHSVVLVALGYSDLEEDYNRNLPKSRLPREEKIIFI